MKIAVLSILFSVGMFAQTFKGAPAYITFHSCAVVLGMPKQDALTALSESFSLKKARSGDVWMVGEKNHPESFVGTVEFRGDKVDAASRSWSQPTDTKLDLAEQFYALVEKAVNEQGEAALVTAKTSRQADLSMKSVDVRIGGKTVSLTIFESTSDGRRAKYATLDEAIGWR